MKVTKKWYNKSVKIKYKADNKLSNFLSNLVMILSFFMFPVVQVVFPENHSLQRVVKTGRVGSHRFNGANQTTLDSKK